MHGIEAREPAGDPIAQPAPPGGSTLQLHGRETEVYELLCDEFAGDAQALYEGAQRALADRANPARIILAAAALRELMDDLEAQAGLAHRMPDWKERIAKLGETLGVSEKSLGVGPDLGMDSVTLILKEFFVEFHSVPTRRELAGGMIVRLDPARREAPPEVRDARAKVWAERRHFFNRVVHRELRPSENEFRRELSILEDFLVDWLRPPTFADLDAIDEVLRMGPPDV